MFELFALKNNDDCPLLEKIHEEMQNGWSDLL
jgi:hypothetical protein